jgi:hypothetical protein
MLGRTLVREHYESTTVLECEIPGNNVAIYFKEPLKRVKLSDAEIGP